MRRKDQYSNARRQAITAKLNRRALASFYYFAREFISKKARFEKHLCLTNSSPYPLLEGTPILDSPKFNVTCLSVADMYPSDDEYDAANDHDLSEDDDKSDDDIDDAVETALKNINDTTSDGAFEITFEGRNPEDGDSDDNIEFTDSKNEYNIGNQVVSTATMIRPKKKLRNSSSIRTEEYMTKYNDEETWTEIFL